MSSTSRGGQREPSDYYVTPQWAIMDFLNEFTIDSSLHFADDLTARPLVVLDPCAGGDKDRGMAYPDGIKAFNEYHSIPRVGEPKMQWQIEQIITMDIRADSRAKIKGDYLHSPLPDLIRVPDIIITNPPFSLAMPIIEKALEDVRQGGFVVMLQRLNFFGGQKEKRKFFENVGLPLACYVHRKRMHFMPAEAINPNTGKKYAGDSIEYAHFVWRKGYRPDWTKLRII